MQLTVEIDEREFVEAVVQAAAEKMLEDKVGVDRAVLARRIERKVESAVREEAQAAAPGIVQRILADRVIQTNEYGYPHGEGKPVAAVIADQVKKELAHSNGRRGPTVLDKLIRDEVDRALAGELKDTLDQAKRIVTDAVSERAISELRKSLADGIAL